MTYPSKSIYPVAMRKKYWDWTGCRRVNHAMLITLDEWCYIWTLSGLWKLRGSRKHNYCMCRIDLEKPWSADNITIESVSFARRRARAQQNKQ